MSEACEEAILAHLAKADDAVIEDTLPWSEGASLGHEKVVGALKSLEADGFVVTETLSASSLALTKEGEDVLANGSQEAIVLKALEGAGKMSIPDLQAAVGKDVAKIGMGNCMKKKWIKKDGGDLVPVAKSEEITDEVQDQLKSLADLDKKTTDALKKRKLVTLLTRKSFKVTKGASFAPKRVKKAADLTKEMLETGAWKDTPFKPYNFLTLGEKVGGGYLHPLLKVRAEFRKILMEMGFHEMPTNKWVESSFWNFDSLFQPQSHPARDAHDTFFIKEPASTVSVPEEYYERVKTMHEKGGSGSIGYRYDFKREEAFKNLLRTHTTAISSQMLYKLANQEGGFKPARYYSIDRVFRNETMDATHLCEFHQVEGLVADYDLSLGDLIGTIETFFRKIGITQLRFKPAFNPYTEPSMEIFGYHPDLKKWTEIGNSGMFRPEMLAPMGLPENVRVIAWGLSLERPTMIKYRIKNIRDLFGHKVELARTQTAPICRF
ncbi:Phenylalanine--tRNA ligase alpha subunit [Seminavis robusta]|uniref:phenylalanine--tRNA ligase n=1 Tax=Seminavis robusta TaxID=568900 RepID=A0A9N8HBH0_9STRA|nr:Phenylalanine--tRNA ligase alpha subunit [Seminavis robusta]|eukprot:Sro361_g126590.1 Phenylalanine--tRNA ligase alpha subunit (493) ;mRNA; r:49542-51105